MPEENSYDGVIALNDAGIREAESQSRIALQMAETALKWQEVQHKNIKNLELFLKVKWDAQAHDNLHRLVVKSQHRVLELQEIKKNLERKLGWANKLLYGAELSIETLSFAWQGFYFLRNNVRPSVVLSAYQSVQFTDDIFTASSWCHPFTDDGAAVHDFQGRKDPTSLFMWAVRGNYYPTFSEPAWVYLKDFMEALNDAAEKESARMDAVTKDAEQKALDLSKIDWDRLKQPINEGTQE